MGLGRSLRLGPLVVAALLASTGIGTVASCGGDTEIVSPALETGDDAGPVATDAGRDALDASLDACVDTRSDPDNCGACGTACAADEVCELGRCATACSGRLRACRRSCVDVTSDPDNCGACGTSCASTFGVCSLAACAAGCAATLTACGSACVDTRSNDAHCGACGIRCAAGLTCTDGACR